MNDLIVQKVVFAKDAYHRTKYYTCLVYLKSPK